jgi:hypothetical protein
MNWKLGYTTRPITIDGETIAEGELVQVRESVANEGGWLVRTEAGTEWFAVAPVRF